MESLKQPKRIIIPEGVYFVTVNTQGQYPYFHEKILCELWMEELRLCKELKGFQLLAFCLNEDHFHMLLKPSEKFDVSKVMKFFKENFSRDANKIIFNVADTAPCRLQISSKINDFQQQFLQKYGTSHSFPRFAWQRSFYDHVIRDERDLEEHFKYTAYNFDKHKLSENWKYTSLNFPGLVNEL